MCVCMSECVCVCVCVCANISTSPMLLHEIMKDNRVLFAISICSGFNNTVVIICFFLPY